MKKQAPASKISQSKGKAVKKVPKALHSHVQEHDDTSTEIPFEPCLSPQSPSESTTTLLFID